MKKGIGIGVLALMLLTTGCYAPKTILSTPNVTQPVLVGNIKNIKGEKFDPERIQEGVRFSADIENSDFFTFAVYSYSYVITTEPSNIIDSQILPIIDERPIDPNAMIVVDQVRYKVTAGYWLFVMYTANKGWIDGSKCSNSQKHAYE